MIIDKFIEIIFGAIMLPFVLIPGLPPMPDAVTNGSATIIGLITDPANLLTMIYTAPLLIAVVAIALAIMSMETAWFTVLWILKKIPFINIK